MGRDTVSGCGRDTIADEEGSKWLAVYTGILGCCKLCRMVVPLSIVNSLGSEDSLDYFYLF